MDSFIEERDFIVSAVNESVHVTIAEILRVFKDIWRNERYAPELLPEKVHIVDCLLEQIASKEEYINTIRTTKPSRDDLFFAHLQKMEINRLRYMLANYLRCRLDKIERFAIHLTNLPQNQRLVLLSPQEVRFLDGFVLQTEDLIKSSIGMYLPPGFDVFRFSQWRKQPVKPKLDSFVMVKPRELLERVVLDESVEPGRANEIEDLQPQGQYLLRYSSVRDYVFSLGDRDSAELEEAKLILM